MRILVTNDDGVEAPGIGHLAVAARDAGHEVVVVAPFREMSGIGTSTGGDLQVAGAAAVRATTVEGIEAYAVTGPPALCTLLGLRGLIGDAPDLVLSGINAGSNMGPAVLHSGTVGAVLTAANMGTPGMAFSLAAPSASRDGHFETAAALVPVLVDRAIRERSLNGPFVVNVNVPNVPWSELEGVRLTSLAPTPGFRNTGIEDRPGDDGERFMRFAYERLGPDESPEASDVGAVARGHASVTWLAGVRSLEPPDWVGSLGSQLGMTVTT